jgi:hypothetical protein
MGDFPASIPSTVIFPNDVSITDNTDFVTQCDGVFYGISKADAAALIDRLP